MERQLSQLAVGGRPLRRQRLTLVPLSDQLRRCVSSELAAPLLLSQMLSTFRIGMANIPTSGATYSTKRHKSTYSVPSPSRSLTLGQKSRKQYNYLTSSRMIEEPKKLPVLQQRQKDDRTLARRNRFKEQLLRDVEEKIRFFPPLVKKQVFFPLCVTNNRSVLFRGRRDLGTLMRVRVSCMVVEQLKKAEQRPFLLDRMKELDVEPPTAAEWKKFTDPKTGDINVGILYSAWVEATFHSFARLVRKESKNEERMRSMTGLRDYVVQNIANPTLVPPLEEWARAQGPVQATDFIGRSRKNLTFGLERSAKVKELHTWGKQQVLEAVCALSLEEQMSLLQKTASSRVEILQELEERHLFITKFKHVLYSLDEMKSITTQCELFHASRTQKFVIEHKGAYYPVCPRDSKAFAQLSKEEKTRLCAFGYRHEVYPTTGQKLYLRHCVRDYGMTFSEAARRYGRLSDLQRAALCFPFYMPISPARPGIAAFRRFYREMCGRYGFFSSSGPMLGNRLFEAVMRKRWNALSTEERARYEESDSIAEVFPLIKQATEESSTSNTTTMAEYFTKDQPQESSSVDETLASATSAKEEEEDINFDESPPVAAPAQKVTISGTPKRDISESLSVPPHSAAAVVTPATARRGNARKVEPSERVEGLRVIMM